MRRQPRESRIVYVDHDPVVLTHAQALLTRSPEGKTDYLRADLRDTGTILAGAARTLDFARPAAILLIAVLHFISHDQDAPGIIARFRERMAPGSYLAISIGTSAEPAAAGTIADLGDRASGPV